MSAHEDVQAAELAELRREADAVAHSLRELLNQPILAKTVESLASRLAAETARADAAEEVAETADTFTENDSQTNFEKLLDALARYHAAKETR